MDGIRRHPVLVTIAASLLAAMAGQVADQLFDLESLTRNWGGAAENGEVQHAA